VITRTGKESRIAFGVTFSDEPPLNMSY
jgi:hypothetical protein